SGDQEGLGLVVVEAVGCGCPVLVGNVSAVRDVLDEAYADLAIEPANTLAFAETLARMLRDPEGARARTLALRQSLLERFEWEHVAERYSAILTKLAASGSADVQA